MNISQLESIITTESYQNRLAELYGKDLLELQTVRYLHILQEAKKCYGDREAHIVSTPGRTEVGGNHTDHQLGRVIAASIHLDIVAVVIPEEDYIIRYCSNSFKVKDIDLTDLAVHHDEKNTTESLIRGIVARTKELGYQVGGFSIYAESDVLPGSGMSSSAAFEVLIGTIFSTLCNHGAIDAITIAKIGQYAENVYFGKACGLMDQMACSVGGFVFIDFQDKENPIVESVPFEFATANHVLILTDCKQSHSDLSDEYSLIPAEMKSVAKILGGDVLSCFHINQLLQNINEVRETCGDRAFLRAYHFLKETERVIDEVKALKSNDFNAFLEFVKQSGDSSYMYLQNVYPPTDSKHQSLAVGLSISREILNNKGGYRVHGGGFAGTIQAYVPAEIVKEYVETMESIFGKGSCYQLMIRSIGSTLVF